MEYPIRMDDLGVPLFSETSIYWFIGYFFCGESDYSRSISSVEIPSNLRLSHPEKHPWVVVATGSN